MAGYIAAFILAFYSLSIYYDGLLLRESLIASSGIFLLYMLLKAEAGDKPGSWFLSGAILGLMMLMRHNILFPFILAYIFFTKSGFKRAFRYAAIFTAGFFIVIMPVLARNYIVSDYKYIGISKEVNAFWVGNNPAASGVDVDWSSGYSYLNDKAGGSAAKTAVVFLEEIKKNPGVYTSLYLRKLWMFFNGYEAPSNTNYYLYREEFPTVLRWPLFNFQFISSLGMLGVFLSVFRKPARPYMAYVFLFVLSASVILFHIQDRFRLIAVPFFIIFASYSIYYIIAGVRNRAYLMPVIAIMAASLLFVLVRPDLTYGGFRTAQDKIRPVDRTNLSLAYIDNYEIYGDDTGLEKALRQCGIAIKGGDKDYVPRAIKGRIYFLRNKFRESMNEYKKALIYANRNQFLYNELAGVCYGQKDYAAASLFIKRALRLSPGNKVFERNMSLIPVK